MEILSYLITIALGLSVLAIPVFTLKYILYVHDKPIGDHLKEALKISESLADDEL